jgi:hypothetical protein
MQLSTISDVSDLFMIYIDCLNKFELGQKYTTRRMPSTHLRDTMPRWCRFPLDISVVDAGASGDCLFYCLAALLTASCTDAIDMQQARQLLAQCITALNMDDFVRQSLNNSVPAGYRSLRMCHSLSSLRRLVRTQGFAYQGTDVSLAWLVKYDPWFVRHKVGFVIFSSYGPAFTSIVDTSTTTSYMLLYNISSVHWQVAMLHGQSHIDATTWSTCWRSFTQEH